MSYLKRSYDEVANELSVLFKYEDELKYADDYPGIIISLSEEVRDHYIEAGMIQPDSEVMILNAEGGEVEYIEMLAPGSDPNYDYQEVSDGR